eukprot:6174768-Pleurochrysis_carterae.AAC.4
MRCTHLCPQALRHQRILLEAESRRRVSVEAHLSRARQLAIAKRMQELQWMHEQRRMRSERYGDESGGGDAESAFYESATE